MVWTPERGATIVTSRSTAVDGIPGGQLRADRALLGRVRRSVYSNGSTNFFFFAAARRFTAAVRRVGARSPWLRAGGAAWPARAPAAGLAAATWHAGAAWRGRPPASSGVRPRRPGGPAGRGDDLLLRGQGGDDRRRRRRGRGASWERPPRASSGAGRRRRSRRPRRPPATTRRAASGSATRAGRRGPASRRTARAAAAAWGGGGDASAASIAGDGRLGDDRALVGLAVDQLGHGRGAHGGQRRAHRHGRRRQHHPAQELLVRRGGRERRIDRFRRGRDLLGEDRAIGQRRRQLGPQRLAPQIGLGIRGPGRFLDVDLGLGIDDQLVRVGIRLERPPAAVTASPAGAASASRASTRSPPDRPPAPRRSRRSPRSRRPPPRPTADRRVRDRLLHHRRRAASISLGRRAGSRSARVTQSRLPAPALAAAMGSWSEVITFGALTEASGGNSRVSVSGASCDTDLGHRLAAGLVGRGVGLGALCFCGRARTGRHEGTSKGRSRGRLLPTSA